jgi:hypothetical protein
MAGRCAPISPERAKAILDGLSGHKSLAALRRELVRRGRPVSAFTLRKWRTNGWTRKGSSGKPAWAREAGKVIKQSGLPDDVVAHLEASLKSASDAELGAQNMRALLINSVLLMAQANAVLPELIKTDPRGLAVIYRVAAHVVRSGVTLMQQTRELSERAMRERLRITGGVT